MQGFEAIYPDLAAKYDLLFYPFFLDGIAGDPRFNQRDGLHPTAAGVDVIVAGILPKAEELVARGARARVTADRICSDQREMMTVVIRRLPSDAS